MTTLKEQAIERTKKWITEFQSAIETHDNSRCPESVHPEIWKAMRAGMVSQVEDLKQSLHNLEALPPYHSDWQEIDETIREQLRDETTKD